MLKNLIITGFMLSGKTSIGKLLSKKIEYNFIDLDKLIEIEEKKSIKDIFEEKGEKYFRQLEYENLKTFLYKKNNIISLGGGGFCSYKNINLIKKIGLSVFIYSDLNEILYRANKKEIEKRPLFNKNLEILFYKRQKYYNKAIIKIMNKDKNLEDICNEIIEKIKLIK